VTGEPDAFDAFDALGELLPEPMLLVRADGGIERANRSFVRTFGYNRRQLAGRSLVEIAHANEPLAELLLRCAGTRELLPAALSVNTAHGDRVECHCEGAVFVPAASTRQATVLLRFSRKDVAASRFVALTQKIEQLGAEVARRLSAEREVTKERELLEVTLASIGDAVITTDITAHVTFMNRVAEALTGWPLREALGRRIDEVFRIVNEETRQAVENPVFRVLSQGSIVGLANHTVLIARDGRERPIDDSGAPIAQSDGHLHGAVLVFRDVTDLRRAEREQMTARVIAESASRAKDEFLATLSHELRTPLNVILGWARMLRAPHPEKAAERGLQVIERNAAALSRLVEDLLDVSRVSTGKLTLREVPVDIAEVLTVEAESIRPLAAKKGVRLVSSTVTPATVNGDPERLHQVLWNLLSNAVKFTPPGGVVTLELLADGDMAALRVHDTGDGFSPALKAIMFDAFVQGDGSPTRPHGGLGLGLAIVKQLVLAHNGTVHAHSDGPQRGATFTVQLPRVRAESGQGERATTEAR